MWRFLEFSDGKIFFMGFMYCYLNVYLNITLIVIDVDGVVHCLLSDLRLSNHSYFNGWCSKVFFGFCAYPPHAHPRFSTSNLFMRVSKYGRVCSNLQIFNIQN